MIGGHATPASVRFLAIALEVRADILSMSGARNEMQSENRYVAVMFYSPTMRFTRIPLPASGPQQNGSHRPLIFALVRSLTLLLRGFVVRFYDNILSGKLGLERHPTGFLGVVE
jgi:hypothetical protein